jgi:hypothetical protein
MAWGWWLVLTWQWLMAKRGDGLGLVAGVDMAVGDG